uniref:Peptidyl-prolyl cis-trans isomerase n=1 Tax=Aegilops tauschii subsp. strangulata TaxID=200361 RepID=A0A453RS17_AEGTS
PFATNAFLVGLLKLCGLWGFLCCLLVGRTQYLFSIVPPVHSPPPSPSRSLSLCRAAATVSCLACRHLKMWGGDDGGTPEVTLETSMGSFTVEMYHKHAPKTCRNFVELARRKYYDNVVFHRIIKDFIVQGGDPSGTGRGGESIYGAKFEDEIRPELKHTGAGILSMANAGPNTNGSQFFITLAPCQSLDGPFMK